MDSMNIEVFVLLCLSVKVNKDSCFVCKTEDCKKCTTRLYFGTTHKTLHSHVFIYSG